MQVGGLRNLAALMRRVEGRRSREMCDKGEVKVLLCKVLEYLEKLGSSDEER